MGECIGLRERKNARTRIAIERAAAELALELGFEHTTVDQIAARADVSPRTVYGRYPTKDAIIYGDGRKAPRFHEWLDGPADTLVERLGDFIHARTDQTVDDTGLERLRLRAMVTDPYLRQGLRGRLDKAESLIAGRLAEQLGLPLDDAGPRLFAAAVSGLFLAMAEQAVQDPETFDPLRDCARGLTFLSAGLRALRASAPGGAPVRAGEPEATRPAGQFARD
jgi:AcrR family transcriptional regulator